MNGGQHTGWQQYRLGNELGSNAFQPSRASRQMALHYNPLHW